MPRRWRTARRRSTGLRIHRSAWPPGCSTTTRAVSRSSHEFSSGQPEGLTRDDILDNITLYWLTNTAVSSARLYWESKLAFFAPKGVSIPTAVSVFPDEIYAAPKSWTEKAYPKLIYYNRLPKGGHFAAWEQPELSARNCAPLPVAAIAKGAPYDAQPQQASLNLPSRRLKAVERRATAPPEPFGTYAEAVLDRATSSFLSGMLPTEGAEREICRHASGRNSMSKPAAKQLASQR